MINVTTKIMELNDIYCCLGKQRYKKMINSENVIDVDKSEETTCEKECKVI
jgi:hypothetical protein